MGLIKKSISKTVLKASDSLHFSNPTSYTLNMTSTVKSYSIPFSLKIKKDGSIRFKGQVITSYGNTTGYCRVFINGIQKYSIYGTYSNTGVVSVDMTVKKGDLLTFSITGQPGIDSDTIRVLSMAFYYDLTDSVEYIEGVYS